MLRKTAIAICATTLVASAAHAASVDPALPDYSKVSGVSGSIKSIWKKVGSTWRPPWGVNTHAFFPVSVGQTSRAPTD